MKDGGGRGRAPLLAQEAGLEAPIAFRIRKIYLGYENFKLRRSGGMRIILCAQETGPRQ